MLAVYLLLWEEERPGSMLLAVLLHELGHGAAMAATGAGIREIRLYAAGVQMRTHSCLLPVWQEVVLYLSGPAANLLCGALLWRPAPETALLHLGLGLFNLLPFRVLDGGAVLRCLWAAHPRRLRGLGIFCTAMAGAGLVWMLRAHTVPLRVCLMAVYLGICELTEC